MEITSASRSKIVKLSIDRTSMSLQIFINLLNIFLNFAKWMELKSPLKRATPTQKRAINN